jgi:hypothetical protein
MRQAEIPVAAAYPLPKQLKREQSLLRRFGHIARASRGNTGGFRSQRIPQFESEGRTLLHELFATAGDIPVTDREMQITLAPLSSPHRTRAAQALCEMLDQNATIFPGSLLRMRFAMRPPPRVGLAFPGSPVECSTATAVVSAC